MEKTITKRIHILSGTCGKELASDVAIRLGTQLEEVNIAHFANGEIHCRLENSVRGGDVFVFQSHGKPVNESIMEQIILIDAAKRASAKHITAVCPYFGYSRQDRKANGREPITAKLLVDMLKTAGADRIVSVDLHSSQIQGFFNGPFDHVVAMPILKNYLAENIGSDIVIVSPDAGRVKMAERYVRSLNADLAIVHKTRSSTVKNRVEALDVIGDVTGRTCVIIDDMIDTAGTLCAAADQLIQKGASKVYALATHGILSDPALARLKASPIDTLIITNTLPQPKNSEQRGIKVVSVAPLLAGTVSAIFHGTSVSKIFEGQNQL